MHRPYFLTLLIAVVLTIIYLANCDSYNIVEPRFYSEEDILDVPACGEAYQEGRLYCCGDKSERYLNIQFTLLNSCHYQLYVLGSAGNVVRSYQGVGCVGLNVITWDGRDNQGERMDGGIYGISLKAGGYKEVIWFKIVWE